MSNARVKYLQSGKDCCKNERKMKQRMKYFVGGCWNNLIYLLRETKDLGKGWRVEWAKISVYVNEKKRNWWRTSQSNELFIIEFFSFVRPVPFSSLNTSHNVKRSQSSIFNIILKLKKIFVANRTQKKIFLQYSWNNLKNYLISTLLVSFIPSSGGDQTGRSPLSMWGIFFY